jgi:lauroyl/myristoyl acyltransferase
MDMEKYINNFKRLKTEPLFKRSYYQPFEGDNEPIFSNFLTSAAVAMTQLLPAMSFQEQEKILVELGQYLRIQRHDEGVDLRRLTRIEGDINALLSPTPKIICTFHFGSFRYLPYFLLLQKKSFAMLLTEEVIKEQGDRYSTLARSFDKDVAPPILINAQSWTSTVKCLDFLKRGGNLLAYVDGNSGIEGEVLQTEGQMIPIRFLDGEIYVRVGIFLLSYLSKIPITVVVNEIRSPEERVLKIYDPIICEKKDDAENVMTKIFGILGDHIKKDVAQWEGWVYYRRYVKPSGGVGDDRVDALPSCEGKVLRFNHDRFGIIRDDRQTTLIDKKTLGTRRLTAQTFSLLDRIIYADTPPKFENFDGEPDAIRQTIRLLVALSVVI